MILLTRIHNSFVFVTKNFWVFINYTVHENKLTDMCINNINGVINKNLSLFSFPSAISMEGETKTAKIDQKPTFFIFSFFSLKIQNIRKSKILIFERRYHKYFLGQMLTILQRSLQIVVELWNNADLQNKINSWFMLFKSNSNQTKIVIA